jgi:hypothetical protein
MKQELNEAQAAAAKQVIDEILAAEKSWAETVRIGDLVDADRDQHFTFSKTRYLTNGKLYAVKELDFRPLHKSYSVIVDSDVPGEIAWLHDSRVIIRDGIVVWTPTDAGRERREKAEAKGNGSGAAE